MKQTIKSPQFQYISQSFIIANKDALKLPFNVSEISETKNSSKNASEFSAKLFAMYYFEDTYV